MDFLKEGRKHFFEGKSTVSNTFLKTYFSWWNILLKTHFCLCRKKRFWKLFFFFRKHLLLKTPFLYAGKTFFENIYLSTYQFRISSLFFLFYFFEKLFKKNSIFLENSLFYLKDFIFFFKKVEKRFWKHFLRIRCRWVVLPKHIYFMATLMMSKVKG